mmetsp:Transcript_29713/g.47874  ORF Transcript_29713/g.47874 Transcript_29713/m.47874 type:complete len:514 (-) Transcript_29713:177-1718(-)
MASANPSRQKLVEVLVTLLKSKGALMVAEFERRVSLGQGLEARGIKADVETLEEALEEYESQQVVVLGKGAKEVNSPQRTAPAPSSPPKASLADKPGSPQKAGSGGARWMPSAPSASLLAAKALMECERAEPFSRWVRVVASVKVGVMTRPDMHADLTGTLLSEGEKVEVVARYLCQKDGRVYLRLKKESGWITTRSRKDWSKIVLGPLIGEGVIEPAKYSQPLESVGAKYVPELDDSAAAEPTSMAEDLDGDDDEGDAADEAVEEGEAAEEVGEAVEEADEDHDNEGDEEEEEEDEEEEGEEHGDDDQVEEAAADGVETGTATSSGTSPSKVKRTYHKFRVVVGRCPILLKPNMDELMAHGNKVLQIKQEFNADGHIFVPSENRTYLRLTRNRGWICEQSRNDIRRQAVVPSRGKKEISKKRARILAFRGGDTGGRTRLGKDDLMRNSQGKIVSKRASESAKRRMQANGNRFGKWTDAVKRAKEELGLKGFVKVKKGTDVYEKAQAIFKAAK